MKYCFDNIIAEVKRNQKLLLEMYGGVEGLHKHMDEVRPELEKQGFKFLTEEEMEALRNRTRKNPLL